jgi:hypothetical protein
VVEAHWSVVVAEHRLADQRTRAVAWHHSVPVVVEARWSAVVAEHRLADQRTRAVAWHHSVPVVVEARWLEVVAEHRLADQRTRAVAWRHSVPVVVVPHSERGLAGALVARSQAASGLHQLAGSGAAPQQVRPVVPHQQWGQPSLLLCRWQQAG